MTYLIALVISLQSTNHDQDRQLDFILGSWVAEGHFTTSKGRRIPFVAFFEANPADQGFVLQGNLTVHRDGEPTFIGASYLAFDPTEDIWNYEYFWHPQNQWVGLTGEIVNGAFVAQGPGPEGQTVRVTIKQVDEDTFVYSTDVSDDGGVTWLLADSMYLCTRNRKWTNHD